jgi:SOS response regulatory protein OraA/RecX
VAKKDLTDFLNSIQFPATVFQEKISSSVVVEYEVGRKDRVLMRMYEDGYINDTEFHDALVS